MKAVEQLRIQRNAENTDRPESFELVEVTNVEGTPFQIRGNKEDGHFVTLGEYRVSDVLKTKEQAENLIEQSDVNWRFLTTVIAVITEQVMNQLKAQENEPKV